MRPLHVPIRPGRSLAPRPPAGRCSAIVGEYILIYMKRILIELDDTVARDLERVAPAKTRRRAEFVRIAIRRAIDLALDRMTEQAYRERPLAEEVTQADLVGWDDQNALAKPATSAVARNKKSSRRKRAA